MKNLYFKIVLIFITLLVFSCENGKKEKEIVEDELLDYNGYFTIYNRTLGGSQADTLFIVNGKGTLDWKTDDGLIANIYNQEIDKHWAHKLILEKGILEIKILKDSSIIVGGTPNNEILGNLNRKKEVLRLASHKIFHYNYKGLSEADSIKIAKENSIKTLENSKKWRKLQLDLALESEELAGLTYVPFNLKYFEMNELKTLIDNYSAFEDNPSYKSLKRFYEGAKRTAIGAQAPEFSLPNIRGKKISLSDKKGKIVLLDFWASWCIPCRKEIPHLKKIHKKYKDRGFETVSISTDKKELDWRNAVKEEAMPWDQLLDNENDASKKYHIISIPQLFILDENGFIIGRNVRGKSLEKKMEELFPE
ncbi:TlpA disulfide reductase family protein [uncultured Polaribacter sp.]|uniref:TlpA family protein disulfide reductase n=1 Tax=uncultured Polaribacter sp. TaxID=174711 RepID=UPI00263203D8|nr:TlpA disulfide reductase family protein [uncultured Polaribacter sp.]